MRGIPKSLPCGLVVGKSLMSLAIVAKNLFRLSYGRLVGLRPRFRFKSYDINHLPRKPSPHGGA